MEMTSRVKHNSFERPETFQLLSEIRKRIITFRHIIDLPPCHSSDLMHQLVMGTIEDLHYSEVVICNFTAETEESFLHQALSHLYNILEVIRDSWAKTHKCIIDAGDDTDDSMEHITAEQLSRRVLLKLDQMIDIAREMWIEEYEKKNKCRVQGSEAEDTPSESLPNKKVKCLSPNTPVSYYSDLAFAMDSGKLANASYSLPLQFHFRLQVLEKLKPIELKYVPLDTCPLTSSPGYSMSNVTRITLDETKAEVQDIVASPDKVSHRASKTSEDSETSSKTSSSNRNVMPEAKESAVESADKGSYQVSKKSDSEESPKTTSSNINLKIEAKRSAVESADKVSYQASKSSKDSKMSPTTSSSDKNMMPEGKGPVEESADKVNHQLSNILRDSGKSPKTSSSNMNVMPGTKGLAAMPNSPSLPTIPARPSSQPSSAAVAPPPPPPPAPPSKGSVPVTSSPMPPAKGAVPPPPPPLLGVARALRARTRNKLKRSSHMGNLYRLLKGKLEGFSFNGRSPKGRKSKIGGSSGSTQSMADALAEMTKRSAYFHQIEEDVKKHSKSIMEIKADVNSFQTKDMAELLKFQKHVEQTLEKLTDETQVLAKFEGFPSKKLESLRAAAALYSKLDEIATTLENWKVMPPLGQLLDKVQSYFDKIKGEIEALERTKDEESKRFESNNIHFNFRILDRIKESMVDVSSSCMALALAERREAKGAEPRTKGQPNASIKMMWRAFQLAYRVYSFAGGQDDRADVLTKELAHEIEIDPEPQ